MRQSGILASAALFALRNHRERLIEDHVKARRFAQKLAEVPGTTVDLATVETNIVNIDLCAPLQADAVVEAARPLGLLINASGPRRLRAVMHLDVPADQVDVAADLLAQALASARAR